LTFCVIIFQMPPLEIVDFGKEEEKSGFDLEKFLLENKFLLIFVFIGLVLVGAGLFFLRTGGFSSSKVEVVETQNGSGAVSELVVEIAGAVEKPSVYKLPAGSRIDDLLIAAGGLSAAADRDWVAKNINRAAKLTDGQKVFIPDKQSSTSSANKSGGYQTVSTVLGDKTGSLVNINTASAKELDLLPGIGQGYAQKIIEQRPYSTTEELVNKKVIPQSTYEKIKDRISVW